MKLFKFNQQVFFIIFTLYLVSASRPSLLKFGVSRLCRPIRCISDQCDPGKVIRERHDRLIVKRDRCDQKVNCDRRNRSTFFSASFKNTFLHGIMTNVLLYDQTIRFLNKKLCFSKNYCFFSLIFWNVACIFLIVMSCPEKLVIFISEF